MQTTPIRSFECRIRLSASGVSITSPRTGHTLTVATESAPRRVRGRIVQARSLGRPTAAFTAEELHSFLAAARAA